MRFVGCLGRERAGVGVGDRSGSGDHLGDARVERSDEEWRKVLSRKAYHVLREKGTEPPGSGEYNKAFPESGYFCCAACGNPLYSAQAKFDSGCGWPAFDKAFSGAIHINVDHSHGQRRTEITCAKCDGHLGHVFRGEGFTQTNERSCVNSLSIKHVDGEIKRREMPLLSE
mmetsp:Transcript_13910/g.28475  ORF Transcript_13910/g.28475 Transcript_13910/m.28475 type:complete len:171 (+) Transcript_13910:160-672(+)